MTATRTENIKYITGNLLDMFERGEFDAIAHGCNMMNVMGAGIAAQIKKRFHLAYEIDKKAFDNEKVKSGGYSVATYMGMGVAKERQFRIFNLYTQKFPGPDFRIELFEKALTSLSNINGMLEIGIPRIGAGIGGGNWIEIEKVIQRVWKDSKHNLTIVTFGA